MGEVSAYPHGTFCYVDLGSHDVGAAKRFYAGVLGWEFTDIPAGDEPYTLCRLRGRLVAGIHPHGSDERSFWASYIAVDDNAAAMARAVELGAEVLVGPVEIPSTARMSFVRDPAGASVGLWEGIGLRGAELVNDIGAWCWNELVTRDLDAAEAFYSAMFGWTAERAEGGQRVSLSMDRYLIGGMHAPFPGQTATPEWSVAFAVEDADASAAEAERLGGAVVLPPMDVPVGRFAAVTDPSGAELSLTAFPAGPFHGVDGS